MNNASVNWKHFTLALAISVAGYFLCFNFIEHRRARQGPWVIEFSREGSNLALHVSQRALDIRQATIQFTNTTVLTNLSETIQFEAGREVPFAVPFGKCVFQDPLFLPGTVALEIAGHEIQLMPHTLTLDGVSHNWTANQTWQLGGRTESAQGK